MLKECELKERALHYCRKFLGGCWLQCSPSQFIFQQIKGALTNYIYTCELDPSVLSEDHEHRKILLRLYGEISGPHEKFCEILLFNILSERKLGPKLLGAFKNGRIEQFLPALPLTVHDLRTGRFIRQIAEKIAKYHLLDIPFSKKPDYVSKFVSKFMIHYQRAIVAKEGFSERQSDIIREMISMNIVEEYENLLKFLDNQDISVGVFCHNDVQECNLLLYEKKSPGNEEEIILIDFEYSYYGARGYDIGNHFCEWVMQNSAETDLGFDYGAEFYPSYEQQYEFANAYLNCIKQELANAKISKYNYYVTTPEQLINEANVHSLMSHLFWGFWGIAQHYLSHIDFPFLVRIC